MNVCETRMRRQYAALILIERWSELEMPHEPTLGNFHGEERPIEFQVERTDMLGASYWFQCRHCSSLYTPEP